MFRIGRNTFNDRKNKFLMKIPEFKRSGIGLIAEFRGIPNGFPNLEDHPPSLRGTMRPGIVGGSARGEDSWVSSRATAGHDKR